MKIRTIQIMKEPITFQEFASICSGASYALDNRTKLFYISVLHNMVQFRCNDGVTITANENTPISRDWREKSFDVDGEEIQLLVELID